jgi:hypothetical protein
LPGIAAAQLVEQIGNRAGLHDKELLKEHGDALDRRQLDHAHNGRSGRGLGGDNAAGRALGLGYRFGILSNLRGYGFPIFGNLCSGLVIEPPALHHRASHIRLQRCASGSGCNLCANVINADRKTSRSAARTSSGGSDAIRSASLFTASAALNVLGLRRRLRSRRGAAENLSAEWG